MSKHLKGQKSLEMIIGLVILLVVAAVIINIFINYVSDENLPVTPEDSLEARNAQTTCQSLCSRYETTGNRNDAFEYCTKRFPEIDWNRNRKIDSTQMGIWDVCEDSVYCFHLSPCEWRSGSLTLQDCKRIICDAYLEKYSGQPDSITPATNAMLDDMRQGSCTLPSGVDNWWQSYFNNAACG